jgi:chromosome segregation ATPase
MPETLLLSCLQVLSTQLSAAAGELSKLQAQLATLTEEVRTLRQEAQDKGAQLRAAEDKLQEQRQAAAKVSQGQAMIFVPSARQALQCSIKQAVCFVAF